MAPRRKTKKKFREQFSDLGVKTMAPTLQVKWSVPYD